MTGVPAPPEPLAAESFGWVWSRWITLLRAAALAEHRALTATADAERGAAANAVEMCRYDLERFRRETASGLALALRFAAEFEPLALSKAVHDPLCEAAARAADQAHDDLRTRLLRLERENEQLRADLSAILPALRLLLAELGHQVPAPCPARPSR